MTETQSVFDVLEGEDKLEQERLSNTRAILASVERGKQRFARFLANSPERIALIKDEFRAMTDEAVSEYGGDPEKVFEASYKAFGGHASDCDCGFCQNKGKGPWMDNDDDEEDEAETEVKESKWTVLAADTYDSEDKDTCKKCGSEFSNPEGESSECPDCRGKTSSWTVISDGATPPDGDNYQSERVSLPSNSTNGLGGPSPKIDKGSAGDVAGSSQSPIDVGSVRNKLEHQDADTKADYNDPDFLRDKSSPIHTDADVEKSVGPPDTDRTKTWTGQENQANPVTSASMWDLVEV